MLNNNALRGFTLIEVLMALAILGICLIAILKINTQQIKTCNWIQQKIAAHWIATQGIYKIRLKIIKPPIQDQNIKILNKNYFWSAEKNATNDPYIHKITVKVSLKPKDIMIYTLQALIYA